MTSVNSNNKSSHVASNFAGICSDDFRRVCSRAGGEEEGIPYKTGRDARRLA